MTAAMPPATGQCLCGDIGFTARLPSKWVAHCHCTMCQRGGGAAFVTWVGMEDRDCSIRDPHARLQWYRSSDQAERGFCNHCGSTLFFRSQRWPGELHITLANFSGPIDRVPQAHVFWDTRVPWVHMGNGDGLPRTDAQDVT